MQISVRAIEQATQNLAGWRRSFAAMLAGLISVLAMAPFYMSPLLFMTLPILVWLIDGAQAQAGSTPVGKQRSPWKNWRHSPVLCAAASGWWFGFGYFAGGLFWIGEAFLVEADKFAWALPFAVTLMPAGLALFWALATGAAALVWRGGASRVLALGVSLSGFEWLRGHVLTGFPWNLPGYALTYPLPLMQSAGLMGVYTLTLIAIVIFAAPAVIWSAANAPDGPASASMGRNGGAQLGKTPTATPKFAAIAIAILPLLAMALYGWWRLSTPMPEPVAGVSLRIVQPSISQKEKWLPQHQLRIFNEHLALSRRNSNGATDDLHDTSLLIWPEAAMPFLPLRQPQALEEIAKLLPAGTHLLSGALRAEDATRTANTVGGPQGSKRKTFNSILVFDDKAGLSAKYDKTHLVPFGEYLPFQSTLEAIGLEQLARLRGGFASGREPRALLRIKGVPPIGPLICYEAIFPGITAKAEARPQVLINVTNDGWFGNTTGPRQHLHQARVRAVEEGLPLIRAANNGISAVIDPMGRILHRLGMNKVGVIDSILPAALAAPPYSSLGDSIFWIMWLVCITVVLRNQYRFGL